MGAVVGVPRPKGVTVAAVMWAAIAASLGFLTLRSYLTGGGVLAVPGMIALLTATVAVLVSRGSRWGQGIQLLMLVLGLLAFPFTFVAVILLGYMTRAETVSYFKRRLEGPRWDTPRTWSKSEWPWLLGLAVATGLFAIFLALLLALLRTHPNL